MREDIEEINFTKVLLVGVDTGMERKRRRGIRRTSSVPYRN